QGKIGHLQRCLHLFYPQTSDRASYDAKIRGNARGPRFPTFDYLRHLLSATTRLGMTGKPSLEIQLVVAQTFVQNFHRSLVADLLGRRLTQVIGRTRRGLLRYVSRGI